MKVGIIGGGAWGRALGMLVAEAGHQPMFGYRKRPVAGFPGTPNWSALAQENDLLIVAAPPGAVREVVKKAKPGPGQKVLIASRGLEPETGTYLSDIVLQESACLRVGSLAGPALADEVMQRRPSALVVASAFDEVTRLGQLGLHSAVCRVYTSRDIRGVEVAGAVGRVFAVALGLVDAMEMGVGIHGVIVTRGIAEATRLGEALGAEAHTFSGLAGVGDLVACGSHPSNPNYQSGRRVVMHKQAEPESEAAAAAVLTLSRRLGVEMPLTEAIEAIAGGRLSPRLANDMLMRRAATTES